MKSNQENKPAIIFQSLYLANLLLLPLICFLVLIYYLCQTNTISKFNRIHLIRSVQTSAFAGIMLGIVPASYILLTAEFDVSIMITVFYFVTIHASFVLLGMLNLSRAMANKLPVF